MKKQPVNRMYNFSDAELYLRCTEVLRSANREYELFAQYGYSVPRMKAFLAQCEAFHQQPDDNELVGDQMIVTEKKNQAAENLKTAIRSVMTRVAMKHHDRTGRYRKFGTAKLGDMTDPQLLFCGRRVVRVARQQLDFFAEVGLNENTILRVSEACTNFENALNIQQDKVHDRDIAVEKRIETGNKLYEELITLCGLGKDSWVERDRSRYDFYCLYESNNEQKKTRKTKLSNPVE
jgi:hypothetical protein